METKVRNRGDLKPFLGVEKINKRKGNVEEESDVRSSSKGIRFFLGLESRILEDLLRGLKGYRDQG